MNYQIPLWGSLIISNMHIIAENNLVALMWVGLAILIVTLEFIIINR